MAVCSPIPWYEYNYLPFYYHTWVYALAIVSFALLIYPSFVPVGQTLDPIYDQIA